MPPRSRSGSAWPISKSCPARGSVSRRAHLTPDGLTSLGPDALRRAVFHAACGRLHVFPAEGDAARMVLDLEPQGFALMAARGLAPIAPAIPPQLAVRKMRAAVRSALDPGGRFAFGEAWEAAPGA